ncbi:MAG: PAS domain S-box protein, partial [Dehalococcoidia bacterium]
ERVDTPEAMHAALDKQTWDIVLSDYAMPQFSMPAALAMVKEKGLDLPFIIVSGAIGEEAAVAAMRDGAHDYVMKGNLAHLIPVVERELRDAEVRRERKQMEQALRNSEEHYSALVGNLTDAVFILKGDTVAWCNDRVEEIYGYPQGELFGKTTSFFYPSDISQSEFTGEVSTAIRKHGLFRSTSRFQKKDGSFADIEYSLSQIPGKDPVELIAVARDVTERKRAEEALRQREEYFRSIIENAQDAIVILNRDGTVRYESPAITRLLGIDPQDGVGMNPFEDIHPDELKEAAKFFDQLVRNPGSTVRTEIRWQHADGSWLTLEIIGQNLLDNPAVSGIVANIRDITEKKAAEEALQESEAHYRLLAENVTDVICTLDMNLQLTYISPSITHQTGYTVEELTARSLEEIFLPPDSVELIRKTLTEETAAENMGQKDPGRSRTIEMELNCKDGSTIWIEAEATFLRDPDGQAVGILAVLRDISERKRAEEALQESEKRYRLITENVTDVIVSTDMNMRPTYMSPSVTYLLGYSVEEAMTRKLEESLTPASRQIAAESLAKAMAIDQEGQRDHSKSRMVELEFYRKDGSTVWVEVAVSFLRDSDDQHIEVVSILRDISERKQAEEERKRLEQQLQLAGRLAAVGELAAGIAHELNNPLAAVQAFAQLLSDKDDLEETVKSDVETIYREAQRATRITTNLLRFARRSRPEKRLVSLNEAVEKSLELHAYRMNVNNIEVVTELEPDLPMTMADSDQMHQVFVNIITNAEQAMTEAHGRGRLSVKTQKAGKMIQITFTDSGPGISEGNLKSIFDPFFTSKDVGKGTGLGLSICYGIVQEHSGYIYAKSKPGEGTTFTVEIPIVSEEQPIPEQTGSIEVQRAYDSPGRNN